ncbi:hypothetical protein [Maribellus mangrovi]|uniref:hypothetical protein n=1 Tax=Maribellus mangrovi TaxID=3133146 RepID=UPI0030EB7FE4
MDDLIVIILTLVVAVIGIIGQRNKRKIQQGQAPSPGANQPMDLWDAIMGEEDRRPEYQPQQEVEEQELIEQPKEKPRGYEFVPSSEGTSEIEEELRKAVQKKPKKVKVDGEDFSLRKAVIYQEIMNRKYT